MNEDRTRASGPVSLGDNISITADPATNSLVIYASKQDYERILTLLKDLDIKRRQVLVEAVLLEVGIDDAEALGFSFATSTGGTDGGGMIKNGNVLNSLANPGSIQGFAIAAASAGTLTLPNGTTVPTQSALLTAVQDNGNVNVLSAPTILTTDNEEAEIVVGQNVPFLASTSSNESNLNNTFNQIDRQDVGITLRIVPQISSGEFVTLKIFTEVSNVIDSTANSTLGPTTTIRTSDTTVITKDSQMVVTGGLISDGIADSENGVPYLMDIPVLGHLFKTTSGRHRKTNLLIFITPRIIKDQFDHREVTIAQRNSLEKEMAALKSYPDRLEYLRDERMDKVAEALPWDGPKPGTILPPIKEQSSEQKITLESVPQNSNDIIELKVAPKLPNHESSSGAKKAPEPKIPDAPLGPEPSTTSAAGDSAASVIAPSTQRSDSGARFVVLEVKKGTALPPNVPFSEAAGGGLVALSVGPDNPKSAREFFSVGGEYRYEINGQNLVFTAVGVYGDPIAARKLHKRLPGQWYPLSPYEIMNLGSGPWRSLK